MVEITAWTARYSIANTLMIYTLINNIKLVTTPLNFLYYISRPPPNCHEAIITDRIQIAQSLKVTLRSVCKCLQCEVLRFNMHDYVYYDYKQAQK
jgi:hypothetical protein